MKIAIRHAESQHFEWLISGAACVTRARRRKNSRITSCDIQNGRAVFRHKTLVVALTLACAQVGAAPVSWRGDAADQIGDWSRKQSWSGNKVPTASDDVTINPIGAQTITYLGAGRNATVRSISMDSTSGADTLEIVRGILNVSNAFTAATASVLHIDGGMLNLNGSSALGVLRLEAGAMGGSGKVAVKGPSTLGNGTMMVGQGTTAFQNNVTVNGVTTFARSVNVEGNAGIAGGIINNLGTFSKTTGAASTISSSFYNAGTVNAGTGTLTFSKGVQGSAGVIQTSGGTLSLGTTRSNTSSAKILNIDSGAVVLAADLTVSGDYTSLSGFGTGNAFNNRAHVTGPGAINAAGSKPMSFQQLSVDGGATKTAGAATLDLGNVHVGASVSKNYQIYNMAGSGGVTLRGAIQGAGVNSQLSGSGVDIVGSNWTALPGVAPSGVTKTVSFMPNMAGALTGQSVSIVNNFSNTNRQVLTITGTAYNLAAANAAPASITIAAQRVGGTNSQLLTVSNIAPVGSYTERLDARFGMNGGSTSNNGGAINRLAAGSSNSTAMGVGVDTTTAGAKSGSVTLDYLSDGNGTSGLGKTRLASDYINVSGNVYQPASASVAKAVDFGIVHVGDAASRNVAVTNTAPGATLGDTLQGTISGGGTAFRTTGAFAALASQMTDSSNLTVALNTASAGSFTSTATAMLASHNNQMNDLALATQSVALTGQVNNYAKASFGGYSGSGNFSGSGSNFVLDFGSVKAGTGSVGGSLYVLNVGGNSSFTDVMNGAFTTTGAPSFTFTGLGPITGLTGGSGQAFSIALNNTTSGKFNEFINVNYGGTNASGYANANLGSISLELRGVVSPVPEPSTWAMLMGGLAIVAFRAKKLKSTDGNPNV